MSRIAILAGTNYEGQSHALRGCLNDMSDIKAQLKKINFEGQIIEVLSKDMTTQNWLSAIEEAVANAKPGDVIFHAHSHHGAQVQDEFEEDGLAEVWCPDDFDWSPERMIKDEQMRAILERLPVEALFVDWADCCHASDSLRTMPFKDEKPRFLANPALTAAAMTHIASTVVDPDYSRCIQLAACRSEQTSADARINGYYCGAFTHYALQVWSVDWYVKYGRLIDQSKQLLSRNGYSQSPEYCGNDINTERFMLS